MKLHDLLDEGLVLPRLEARDRTGVLRELAACLETRHETALDGALLDKLLKREELGTTAIGHGVAVPHCRAKGLKAPALARGCPPTASRSRPATASCPTSSSCSSRPRTRRAKGSASWRPSRP